MTPSNTPSSAAATALDESVIAVLDAIGPFAGVVGTQVSVVDQHGERHAAVGRDHRGEPMRADTPVAAYCAAKPILALAVLRLHAEGHLDLDAPLRTRLVDVPAWLGDATPRQVLLHSAGLHAADPVTARLLPETLRPSWVATLERPTDHVHGTTPAYAEFGGWFILGLLVEQVTGLPYGEVCRMAVLEPYGVQPGELVVQPGLFDLDLVGRVAVSVDLTRGRPVPLLSESGALSATEWNPAYGAIATSAGLARVYRGMLEDREGAGAVLPAALMIEATRPHLSGFDKELTRHESYGLGVMCGLEAAGFGSDLPADSFGHHGAGGLRFAVACPGGPVVVVLCTAMVDWPTARSLRGRLMAAATA